MKNINKSAFRRAFTLIELLIVVAIIAILAAIAVPNFLEAQMRAKVSRTKSDLRVIDNAMKIYYNDFNEMPMDSIDEESRYDGIGWSAEGHPYPDWKWAGNMSSLEIFYSYGVWSQLTTPISYITSIPIDPFSKFMPFGYDTMGRWCNIVSSCGPDHTAGDWFRDATPNGIAIPYDTTNGTKSRGDLWRAPIVKDHGQFLHYFTFEVFD